MNNYEFRKRQYEKHPWAWQPRTITKNTCVLLGIDRATQLRPILPANLPEPPEQAYCTGPDQPGGVFLQGPVKKPEGVNVFSAWFRFHGDSRWLYSPNCEGGVVEHYIIDLSDPNAEEIITLNRPEAKDRNRKCHREICSLCHEVNRVGFWVPDEVWRLAMHQADWNDIVCLQCFTRLADERGVDWSERIEFYPVSRESHDRMVSDPTGLTEESRQCYSVEGLKAFVAKHHPHLVMSEQSDQQPEWVWLDECEFQYWADDKWWHFDPEKYPGLIKELGPASVRVRRRKE